MDNDDGWKTVAKPIKQKKNDDNIPKSFEHIKKERLQMQYKKNTPTLISKQHTNNCKKQANYTNIENKIDDGTYETKTINSNLSKLISSERQKKGWSQKDFATMCNLNISVIKNYENGIGTIKANELSIMSTILGISLSNK